MTIQENAFSVTPFEGRGGYPKASGFIASKNGTKYYPIDCASANRIKPENRLYFALAIDAQKAGYEPAVSCLLSPSGGP